jgi:hypothetical protein
LLTFVSDNFSAAAGVQLNAGAQSSIHAFAPDERSPAKAIAIAVLLIAILIK